MRMQVADRFSLRELVDEVRTMFLPSAKSRGLRLRLNVYDNIDTWVMGDVMGVRQVLVGLLSHALRVTSEGLVSLTVSKGDGNTLRFEVRDSGDGVSNKPRSSDGLQHVNRHEKWGGGLKIKACMGLVERMGGPLASVGKPGWAPSFGFNCSCHRPRRQKKLKRRTCSWRRTTVSCKSWQSVCLRNGGSRSRRLTMVRPPLSSCVKRSIRRIGAVRLSSWFWWTLKCRG